MSLYLTADSNAQRTLLTVSPPPVPTEFNAVCYDTIELYICRAREAIIEATLNI